MIKHVRSYEIVATFIKHRDTSYVAKKFYISNTRVRQILERECGPDFWYQIMLERGSVKKIKKYYDR